MSEWQPSACILCENNCGIQIKLGGEDNRHFEKVRGDGAHPASAGYLCQKASRLDYYQNGSDRVTKPLRRKADGGFEEIDWDTAISEIAAKLGHIRDTHGGESIFYYGGGGQGNHLPAAYAMSTLHALGTKYRSNALAQEKTGEAWVASRMFAAMARSGDFENCEVGVFIGKNPWQSHGVPRARVTVRDIAKDPQRTLVVFDPRVSETAAMADFHVQVKPGTDAWALSALLGVLAQEDLAKNEWLDEHTTGMEQVLPLLKSIPVAAYCAHAGVPEQQIRQLAQRLAVAESIAFAEDLGVQMNHHSTLVSYLNRLLWLLTGSFGKKGSQYVPTSLRSLMSPSSNLGKISPVAGAPIVSGLVPCNVIADEVLTEHSQRYRAMIIEAANPAHSLAQSGKFTEALDALECCMVIDVAMTETARHAHYVLPTPTQYEKAEATFFNFEMPHNYFQLRAPVLSPPADADVLPEAEIHSRLVEALGAMPAELEELRAQLQQHGRADFVPAFLEAVQGNPQLIKLGAVLLYRILGPELPTGLQEAAALWPVVHMFALQNPDSLQRAGFDSGAALFETILQSSHGCVFAVDDYSDSWQRLGTVEQRIQAVIPELLTELEKLGTGPSGITSEQFPFVLSAGERRSFTANTICRDPAWRKKDFAGALRMNAVDAQKLGLQNGNSARVSTSSGSATVAVEISDAMQAGHISLPNGQGLDTAADDGLERVGLALNELTSTEDCDAIVGTPWHKAVPAQIESL
ncbi:MAG: molybdopterin-dependent oxidoreductase [Pseudomonadales bacterium]